MRTAGIDLGSRTIKIAVIEERTLLNHEVIDTGIDPLSNAQNLLDSQRYERIVATGYGRYLAQMHLQCPVITEIKAHAIGANFFYPNCHTVLDIGGQDSKVIRIENGRVQDFEMNDKCAAGTGKFLEVMATTLGYTLDEFSEIAAHAGEPITISSMCTVFAESEVVSLISRGVNRQNIALGVHLSILNRILSLIGRTGYEEEIVFSGGVAKNKCMTSMLTKRLGLQIQVPPEPQIIGAVGAALSP